MIWKTKGWEKEWTEKKAKKRVKKEREKRKIMKERKKGKKKERKKERKKKERKKERESLNRANVKFAVVVNANMLFCFLEMVVCLLAMTRLLFILSFVRSE